LNEARIRSAKTPDLGALLMMLEPIEPLWLGMEAPLKALTDFAVLIRYPNRSTDRSKASIAFVSCTKFRELARSSLGLSR
jgi:hypothetical protein